VALDYARRSYQKNIAPDATASQTATRAAAWIGNRQALTDALDAVRKQPGRVSSVIRREAEAALAALDQRRPDALASFADATRRWRELGLDFEAAVCGLSLVITLGPSEPEVRAAGVEVAQVFDRLGALPFQKLLADAMGRPIPAPSPPQREPLADEMRASASRAE
jgi:hypothetical protein